MTFVKLRSLLNQKPSHDLWKKVCRLFSRWQTDDIELALSYANEHMEHWNAKYRHVSNFQPSKKNPVWWPLVRSLEYKRNPKKLPAAFVHKSFANIQKLRLFSPHQMINIDAIRGWKHLDELSLSGAQSLESIASLAELTNLKTLNLSNCRGLKSLHGLENMMHLEMLDLSNCVGLTDISPLRNLKGLKFLKLYQCDSLRALDGLPRFSNMRSLNLNNCSSLRNLDGLSGLTSLEELRLSRCMNLGNVRGLVGLENLRVLNVNGSFQLEVSPEFGYGYMETETSIRAYQERIRVWYENAEEGG